MLNKRSGLTNPQWVAVKIGTNLQNMRASPSNKLTNKDIADALTMLLQVYSQLAKEEAQNPGQPPNRGRIILHV